MKYLVVGAIAIISAVSLSSVGLAQQQPAAPPAAAPAPPASQPAATPATPTTPAAPAAKPAVKAAAKTRTFAGTVVSLDADAKTVTVKNGGTKPEERTFPVDDSAVSVMKGLKAGDAITVSYVEADGKLVAKKLVKPAAKKQP